MPNCPRCHHLVSSTTVTCPQCKIVLKAYGHPGITLHRAMGDMPLCQSCTYDADDTCTLPQRPHAKDCTLYDDISKPKLETKPLYAPRRGLLESIKLWCQQNPAWLLLGLLALSLLMTLIAKIK